MKMKWNLFNKLVPSILKTNLMSDYKIGAAILNAFAKPISCDKEDFSDIATRMLNRVNSKNDLSRIINTNNFQKSRKYFQSVKPDQLFFPKFNVKQLKYFCLGNYAIAQAKSYTADIKKRSENGVFPIFTLSTEHVQTHFSKILAKDFTKPMFIFIAISRYKNPRHLYFI